jgi:hypothetical protein
MTTDNLNLGYNYMIFNEGGDSFRPFIIIKLDENLWITPNICYYRSSGRSNNTPIYSETWLPTGGLVEEPFNDLPKGHILKMSDLYKSILPWCYKLLQSYFLKLFNRDLSVIISNIQQNVDLSEEEINIYKQIYDMFNEVYNFIRNYFCYEWQLKISALLGDGYWNKNTSFYTYIIETINISSEIVIPKIPSELNIEESDLQNNTNVTTDVDIIISFLKNNNAEIINISDAMTYLKTNIKENKIMSRSIFTFLSFQMLLDTYNRTKLFLEKKKGGKRKTMKKSAIKKSKRRKSKRRKSKSHKK